VNCPKCNAVMEVVKTEAGTVDRCTACKGLWFDRLEDKSQSGFSEAVDTGDSERGGRFNKVERILCPVCPRTPLTRMVDNDQPHICLKPAHRAMVFFSMPESFAICRTAR
jgi:uncharacterized protein